MAKQILKPAIENEIAVYRIEDDLSSELAALFTEKLQQHRSILRSLRVRAVLFSLGQINAIDARAVESITDALDLLQRQLRVATGFCEYNTKQYVALRHITRERAVFLYKNFKIAEMALGVSRIRKNSLMLVFDEESEAKNDMVSELISRGYSAVSAMNRADFEKRIKTSAAKYTEVVTQSVFGGMLKMATASYTKFLFVYTFRGALDENSHSTFKRQRHQERIARGYRLFVFDLSKIQMMTARGAYFLYELSKESGEKDAAIAVVGLDRSRVEDAAVRVLEKSHFYFKDTIADVYDELRLESRLLCNRKVFEESVELTKEMITQLPVFLAASLDALESFSGKSCRKEGVTRMTLKNSGLEKAVGIALISFAGDIHGSAFLFIPKEAMGFLNQALIDSDQFSEAEAKDVARELHNAIMGKAKNFLSERGICVGLSLPEGMDDYNEIASGFEGIQGIRLTVMMNDFPIHLFFVGSVELPTV